jgi:AcrR family transcriptional regulator
VAPEARHDPSSADTGHGGPGTRKGEQTRRAVLDAAIERFGREGFRATSVADIARDASVGGTVAYAYFSNKEALFLAALDEDAAAVMEEGRSRILAATHVGEWRDTLLFTLVDALDRHPLARRVLAGLEPDVTDRVIELPALLELRKVVAEKLRQDQLEGLVRADIDPDAVANGAITIVLALLMAILQFGRESVTAYGTDVLSVFEAALDLPTSG